MARPSVRLTEATNEDAVALIEQGLRERKTVKQILEEMRRSPGFAGMGQARLLRQWSQVWRPMIAAGGRVPLPVRGGGRGGRVVEVTAPDAAGARGRGRRAGGAVAPALSRAEPTQAPEQQMPAPGRRQALEQMLDYVSAVLADGSDARAREAALRAFPSFVMTVRSLMRSV